MGTSSGSATPRPEATVPRDHDSQLGPSNLAKDSTFLTLLRPDDIHRVVSLQQRSYGLLRWATHNPSPDQFTRVHRSGQDLEAARDWLARNLDQFPHELRPGGHELEAFARFLSTYLSTSFELVAEPGTRGVSRAICRCDVCFQLAMAPHLRAKKVNKGVKQRARILMEDRVRQVASDLRIGLQTGGEAQLLADDTLERAAALSTYGVQLLEREAGRGEGPAVLALWRRFAWTPQGSPLRGFRLEPGLILEGDALLVQRLRTSG